MKEFQQAIGADVEQLEARQLEEQARAALAALVLRCAPLSALRRAGGRGG